MQSSPNFVEAVLSDAELCKGGCAGSGWEPAFLHPACSRRAWTLSAQPCLLAQWEEDEAQHQDTYTFPLTASSTGNSRQQEVPLGVWFVLVGEQCSQHTRHFERLKVEEIK